MNSSIVTIADKIARNEDVTMEEFTKLSRYIAKANKGKSGNTDDVFSNFVLDVRQHYNPDYDTKAKEAWIYAHIKYSILIQAKFDTGIGMLYNPAPVPTSGEDIDGGLTPEEIFMQTQQMETINKICELLRSDLEKDIYINCILGDTPVAYIAKEYGKSPERGRKVKEKICKKIKEYIDY